MLRSILIALDGSDFSTAAVELGIRWARQAEATLVGLGIVDEPAICKPEPVPMGAGHYKLERDHVLLADARRRVEQFLEQFAQRCDEVGVKHQLLEDVGSPYEQILRESRRCDVIMLGQQTYFHFETQDWPDETLRQVLRQSSRPVVTAPQRLATGRAVVVATNGSPPADRALQAFQELGIDNSHEVYVVCIDADQMQASGLAEQAADYLKLHGIEAIPRPLTATNSLSEMILAQVRELEAHLLVMGAYGRSRWREFVFGSVTSSVLKESAVPLLLSH